jgi:hypothetical protein
MGCMAGKGDVTAYTHALERSGVTSLRDISIVEMHVICYHSNETIWLL